MNWVLWLIIMLAYCSISGDLNSIKKQLKQNKNKNKKFNLKGLVGKNVTVYFDDEYGEEINGGIKGELISFDKDWVEIKKTNKVKKTVTYYYKRIKRIDSILTTK